MDLINLYANNLGGMGPNDCTRRECRNANGEVEDGACQIKVDVRNATCKWGPERAIVYGEMAKGVMVPICETEDGECTGSDEDVQVGENGPFDVDVMITNVTEDPTLAYIPEIKRDDDGAINYVGGVGLNGIKAKGTGEFGVVNVASPSKARLAYDFIDAESEQLITMPNFAITFYDFDCQGEVSTVGVPASGRTITDAAAVEKDAVCEAIQAGDFDFFYVTTTTQLILEVPTDDGCDFDETGEPIPPEEKNACFANTQVWQDPEVGEEAGPVQGILIKKMETRPKDPSKPYSRFVKAKASEKGTGNDNPRYATGLTKLQLDRSITFIYTQSNQMKLTFEVEELQRVRGGLPGRNYLFSFEEPFTVPCPWKGWPHNQGVDDFEGEDGAEPEEEA
jgi:hypothetical protein